MRRFVAFLILPIFMSAMDLSALLEKVQNNDLVQSKKSLKSLQMTKLETIQAAYLPKIQTEGIYSYLRDEDKGLFDPESSISVSASYMLFDGFKKRDLVRAQEHRLRASEDRLAYEKERLSLDAVKLYFQLRTQKVVIEASKQKIRQLQSEVIRLEKLFKAKIVAEDVFESIKASLAMSEYELQRQKQDYSYLRFSLGSLAGEAFDSAKEGGFVETQTVSVSLTKDISAQENELKALQWQGDAQTSVYLPQVVIKDTYSSTQYYESDLSLPGFDLPENNNKFQLLLSWTLVDFGTKSKERQQIYLQKKAMNEELNYYKKSLKSRQELAKMELLTSKKKIRSARQNLKASQKSFDFRKKRFNANLIDSTIFLDALTRFTQAKALYEQSKNDYEIAKANYYFNHNIALKEKLL